MEPALKQRLIGAAVLVAIAVIFLPMLIKGPAPESGVSDVGLELPEPPREGFETRELPLVTPAGGDGSSVTGMPARPRDAALPTVDTARSDDAAELATGSGSADFMPAPSADGNYAVTFGTYATGEDAQRVVDALVASQLPGYQEPTSAGGKTLHRVRIGPFGSRPVAESARLRAAHVRDDVGARVVALDPGRVDGDERIAAGGEPPAPPEKPARPEPEPAATPAPASPAGATATRPAASNPDAAEVREAAPSPAPAAADVGFAVQLGAFRSQADAAALRDRARAGGLTAFIEPVDTDAGRLHRVHVGPVVDRAAAEQLKARAAQVLGVTGFVHAHP